MDRIVYQTPPQWWEPRLNPGWVKFWRFFRIFYRRRIHGVDQIEIQGLEHVKKALEDKAGILITPNHSSHADAFPVYEAADVLGRPFYFMTAWQVFGNRGRLRQLFMQMHGCFSINREGTDRQAIKQAVEILQSHDYPLVIFPEGEVYLTNERITPFREGPAAMALMAAKKAQRPIVIIPCVMRYYYLTDPTPKLLELMDRLERHIYWKPRPDLPLPDRIYRFAQAILGLKEMEILGFTQNDPLPERIKAFSIAILDIHENRWNIPAPDGKSIPERVKALRQAAIEKSEAHPNDSTVRQEVHDLLDAMYLVVQLFSYPGDYVAEKPSIERLAETLDKFEEDIYDINFPAVRGRRKAVIHFGEPIPVERDADPKWTPASLTAHLEKRVQALLDQST